MKTQIQQPKSEASTFQKKSNASRQTSMANFLAVQRKEIFQRETLEDEEDMLQGKFETVSFPMQRAEAPNRTGLSDNLKSGIEKMSGYSMDDVRVHYNSDKPAQLQAHAYTQGTDIHVASGQEKHLPHEAWHVVQQKQGRVQPTTQLQGVNVNDNEGLEKEADVMGNKASQFKIIQRMAWRATRPLGQQPFVGPAERDQGFDLNHDRNIGFGHLRLAHEHIIFSDDVYLPTGKKDNIGFHCATGGVSGPGALFSEEWTRLGYTGRNQISKNEIEDTQLVNAMFNCIVPGYNVLTSNCQDWVQSVCNYANLRY